MKLDRELQLELLQALEDCHPNTLDIAWANELNAKHGEGKVHSNLLYLEEHGLIQSGLDQGWDGHMWNIGEAKILAKGRDFIADDGGLGAILNVVTVKLDQDVIKQLLIDRITESDEPATAKSELIKQVKAIPAEGLKTLTTTALKAALTDLPGAMHRLHTWVTMLT